MSAEISLQRQFFEMLMDSQWWSAEQLLAFQRSQLSQLLRHAKKQVPFYEHRLDPVLKPDGDIDWDRWNEIPIVTRTDMVEHRDAMQARELPAGHGPTAVFHTSGSTGLPIDITSTAVAAIADQGLRWRAQRWHELDWSRVLVSRLGYAESSRNADNAERRGAWGPGWDETAAAGAMWVIDRDLPNDKVLATYARLNGTYLNAGAASSHILAMDAERLGIDLGIGAILTQGNTVRQTDRAICRRVFGARLIETYSSKEGGQLAHECPHGRLHLNVEGSLLEVVNERGLPCRPGESGRVVITPIFQTAQPLIRYSQGDIAAISDEPCACGRHSPTLRSVSGRSLSVFTHPSGEAKVITTLPDDIGSLLHSARFQLAQVGETAFEIRCDPEDAAEENNEAAIESLRLILWSDAEIKVVRRRFDKASVDKLIDIVNEWSVDLLSQ